MALIGSQHSITSTKGVLWEASPDMRYSPCSGLAQRTWAQTAALTSWRWWFTICRRCEQGVLYFISPLCSISRFLYDHVVLMPENSVYHPMIYRQEEVQILRKLRMVVQQRG